MDVVASVLLEGSWYSLEQCGRLLASAVALYKGKDYSTAVAIAMFAHEELGKCRILREEWGKAVQTGKSPSVEQIKDAYENHIEKQKHGQGSVTMNPPNESVLGAAIRTSIEKARTPSDPEYQAAGKVIQSAVEAKEKHDPKERHEKRLQGFFVDLEDSGTTWTRPSKTISQEEALKALRDAANNYAAQQNRFSNTALLEDRDLAKKFDAWTDKPALPPPIWPE